MGTHNFSIMVDELRLVSLQHQGSKIWNPNESFGNDTNTLHHFVTLPSRALSKIEENFDGAQESCINRGFSGAMLPFLVLFYSKVK